MTTTRRKAVGALLCLGSGTSLLCSGLDESAWRAFEVVEETWIRERHALLSQQCPTCPEAAEVDLALKLAELRRRALQFEYVLKHKPRLLRSGIAQLASFALEDAELTRIAAGNSEYRRLDERVRRLAQDLRGCPQYDEFRKAQMRLWKTPEYHSLHRRYSARLKELNRVYVSGTRAIS